MARTRIILTVLAALLAAAWFSPCCCQSAWVAAQVAKWINPGEEAASCCCKQEKHKECCPLGAKKCKQSGAKVATKAGGEAPVVVCAWACVELVRWFEPGDDAVLRGFAAESPPPPRPDVTLVGLHCALVI